MQAEDKALLIGAAGAGLGAIGSILTGDIRYAAIGGLLIAVGASLKATLGPRLP